MGSIRVLILIIAHLSSAVCILSLLSIFAHLLSRFRDWLLDEVRCRIEKIREAKMNEISDQWSKWIEEHQEEMVAELIAPDEEGGI
jgi:hypothetical protein